MAKAQAIGERSYRRVGTGVTLRDYTSLLGVVAAGGLGMSLLCVVAGIALASPNQVPLNLEPASIVNLAISNVNTVAALTVQAGSIQIAITPSPTNTLMAADTSTLTLVPSATSSRIPPPTSTPTRKPPDHHPPATSTPKPPPTKTPKPPPTKTPIPPPTKTPIPPTPIPATHTSIPSYP